STTFSPERGSFLAPGVTCPPPRRTTPGSSLFSKWSLPMTSDQWAKAILRDVERLNKKYDAITFDGNVAAFVAIVTGINLALKHPHTRGNVREAMEEFVKECAHRIERDAPSLAKFFRGEVDGDQDQMKFFAK